MGVCLRRRKILQTNLLEMCSLRDPRSPKHVDGHSEEVVDPAEHGKLGKIVDKDFLLSAAIDDVVFS